MKSYNAAVIRDRGILCDEARGLLAGADDRYAAEFATESVRLAADFRIPAEAIGYVSQLLSPNVSATVRRDAMDRLSQYVEFENAEWC